jgi:YwiC-like protein
MDLAPPGPEPRPGPRPSARSLLVPAEHGGWGLTAEPAALGLLVAWSAGGVAIAVAALLAFLVRTPMKVVLVDGRRRRRLPRTRLAARLAGAELALLAAAVVAALALSGTRWLLPWLVAAPLFAIELSFDARSRGRRLVPEVCGAVGITASAAAIVLAGGGTTSVAIAAWIVLAARAVASVTFARVQVTRGRANATPRAASDVAQVAGVVGALVACAVDADAALGAVCVLAVAIAQFAWSRRTARPAKVVGVWQLVFGIVVVSGTAIGFAVT